MNFFQRIWSILRGHGDPADFPKQQATSPSDLAINARRAQAMQPPTAAPQPTQTPSAPPTPVATPTPSNAFPVPDYQALNSTTSQNWPQVLQQAHDILGKQGFAPAAVLAQLANESGRGTGPYTARNNFFNIGAYTKNPDNAYSYKSPADNINAYANLIATDPRYRAAYQARGNSADFLNAIKQAGYADNPNYVQDIMNTPEYDFYRKTN